MVSKKLDDAFAHLDAMEKKRGDDDDAKKKRGDGDNDAMEKGKAPGEAKEVVADSDPASRVLFADAQTFAERAYTSWGARAPAPLFGERLRDYRIRLLRAMQKHSKVFSASDLESITDKAAFDSVEQSIYADSIAASSAPDSVPRRQLRMVTKRLPSGHLEHTFVGAPQSWMDLFGGSRRYVTHINPRGFKSE
jgi:hypothetical protein